jgi:tetratricopeptide (TPR) repeat protein
MTQYETKDDATMTYLRWWRRPLTNLGIRIVVVGAILFAVQYVYMAHLHQIQIDDSAAYDVMDAGSQAISNTDNRLETLQERLRQNPDDQPAYVQLGAAYLQKARETGDPIYYGKTEEALGRAMELQPDDFAAMTQMGVLSLARHQFREALDWGEKAHAISPGTALIYGVIGDAQIELGQYDAALETFQTMVDLRPDLSSYSRASYLRELHGDVEGAIEAMQQAVQAGGPNAENTNWTRVQLGHLYFNSGKLAEAEAQYKQALAAYPDYVHAIAGLARIHAARGEYDEAIELYTDATNRMPLPEYVIALGDVYEAAGRSREAQQQFDLVRAMERLYAANGVDTDLEMALFEANHSQGQKIDEALTLARRALEKRPTIYAKDVLAWTLYQDGQYASAYSLSRQALQLGTKDALLFFHAGMIALKLGDQAKAREYLEQALTINPHFSILYADQARTTLQTLQD